MRITNKNLLMEQNQKNVLTGLVIVLVIAGLVGFSVWGMTHLTLGKKIGQLYQEKNTFEEMLKNKDKEKEEALEKTIAQFKSVIQAKDQENGKGMGGCVEGSLDSVRSQIDMAVLNNVLAKKDIKEHQEKITHAIWCDFKFDSFAFVFSGDFGKEDTLVGFVANRGNRVVVTSVPHGGDDPFSGCHVTGFIDGNLIYECEYGPDGGELSFSDVYVLHKDSGKNSLVKSCEYTTNIETHEKSVSCGENTLNLAL